MAPGTQYRLGVSARDRLGNENSPIFLTVTTTGAPLPTCTVTYRVTSQWVGAFVAEARVTSATPLTGWSLSWQFPNGQQVTNLWNGNWRQTGGDVTVTNMPYNATSPAFGFYGTWTAVNNSPNAFTLNGRSCQLA